MYGLPWTDNFIGQCVANNIYTQSSSCTWMYIRMYTGWMINNSGGCPNAMYTSVIKLYVSTRMYLISSYSYLTSCAYATYMYTNILFCEKYSVNSLWLSEAFARAPIEFRVNTVHFGSKCIVSFAYVRRPSSYRFCTFTLTRSLCRPENPDGYRPEI